MKLNLAPKIIYGSIQYEDTVNHVIASRIENKWYPIVDSVPFDAGFTNLFCMTQFLENLVNKYQQELELLGYQKSYTAFTLDAPDYSSEIKISDNGRFDVHLESKDSNKSYNLRTHDFEELEDFIINSLDKLGIDIIASIEILPAGSAKQIIEAGISTRDLAKSLVRVKSSNVWSYGINFKNRKDKTGDALIQFKDPNGGAGDLYIYYDVPRTVWKKILSAPSKGHAVWQYLRNNYSYSKLTGDKKGKLRNAINN